MSSAYYSFSVYQAMDSAFRAFESDWLLKLGIVSRSGGEWWWIFNRPRSGEVDIHHFHRH